jgi:DNA-binding transcriptional ArsR family regulator
MPVLPNSPDIFSALASPARRKILFDLRNGPRHVTALAKGFQIGRPAISEHLQVLKRAGLVHEEPRGRERYYHLDPRPLGEVETWLHAFTEFWTERMNALSTLLDEEQEKWPK